MDDSRKSSTAGAGGEVAVTGAQRPAPHLTHRPGHAPRPSPRLLAAFIAGLAALVLAAPAQAQTATTFISNTGQVDLGSQATSSNDIPFAQQFTTGSNVGGYTLSAVVVNIKEISAATPAFALHQSTTVSGVEVPGTKVVDLTGSITTAGEQSFTPATTTTLSASTRYFVVLFTSIGSVTIRTTTSNDEDSGGSTGWEIADNFVFSVDSGSTWLSFDTDSSIKIAVKGTAVGTVTDTTAVR